MKSEIERLFEHFDEAADAVIDTVILDNSSEGAAMLASGLAIRLVQWCCGERVSRAEAGEIAASLVTELTTLALNIKHGEP